MEKMEEMEEMEEMDVGMEETKAGKEEREEKDVGMEKMEERGVGMEEARLLSAWTDLNSSVYLERNLKHLKRYCHRNGINLREEDLKLFLEKQNNNVTFSSGSRVRIAQLGKAFLLEPRFFSQIHVDICFLKKERKYGTPKLKVLIAVCALSKVVFLYAMTRITSEHIISGMEYVIARIKSIDPKWSGGTLFSDGGMEWRSGEMATFLKSVKLKSNVIRIRAYRHTKGSPIAERHIRRFRFNFERLRIANKDISFDNLMRMTETKLNNETLACIGTSPLDVVENHRPYDIVQMLRSYRISKRKYLKRPKLFFKVGSIVRIRLFLDKSFSKKEAYGRNSDYFVVISVDKRRGVPYHTVADILTMQSLAATYSSAELVGSEIGFFQAVEKVEREVVDVISFQSETVIYTCSYRNHKMIAKKGLID